MAMFAPLTGVTNGVGMRVLLGAEIQGLPRRVWVGSSLLLLLSERLTVQLFGLRSRDVSLVAETH